MKGDVEELMLNELSAIRAELEDHHRSLLEHDALLRGLEDDVLELRRGRERNAAANAELASRVDRMQDQIERIDRRLDLTDN